MSNNINLNEITKIDQIEENQFAGLRINNKYLLVSQIGKGTFGLVYKAKDLLDSKSTKQEFLAIKIMILPKTQSMKDKLVESEIKDEIKKYSNQIFNKRVVNIKDSFEHENLLFIVMEYVDGKSLKEVVKASNYILTTEEIIYYFSEIALAVQGMHEMKMIHRDLKPDNILLTSNNEVKITDFGISHIKGFVNEGGSLQKIKKPMSPGTPRYSSPEQYLDTSSSVDISSYQSDIYSIGVMMYETSTGSNIIKAHDPALVNQGERKNTEANIELPKFYLSQTLIKEIIPPTYLNPKIPVSLENIIMKCLEKNVEDRYGTAQNLYDDLIKLEAGKKIEKNYTQAPLKIDALKNSEVDKFKNFDKNFFYKKILPCLLVIFLISVLAFIIYLI